MSTFRQDIINIYSVITEGIEEKIPKLLNQIPIGDDFGGFEIHNNHDKAEFIRWVADYFDPTPNAEYITWLLRMFVKRHLRRPEDAEWVRKSLEDFHKIKKLVQFPTELKDINRYSNLHELSDVLDQYGSVKSGKEKMRMAAEEGIMEMETDDEFTLYVVTRPETAAKYFRNTKWCVKHPQEYAHYNPPFYYFTRNDSPYTLLHLEMDECMDVRNKEKDLDSDESFMMETARMTNFVLEHDNSGDALGSYLKRVGKGYNGQIQEAFVELVENDIAKSNLKYVKPDVESMVEYEDYKAPIFLPYDFKGYEQYYNDPNFQEIVIDVLDDHVLGSFINMEPEFLTKDSFSSNGLNYSINVNHDTDHEYLEEGKDTLYSRIKFFIHLLQYYEDNIPRYTKHLNNKLSTRLSEAGYNKTPQIRESRGIAFTDLYSRVNNTI